MTMLLSDYSNLNNIIDELRKPREEEELTVYEQIGLELKDLKIMFDYGWPYQDIMETADEELSGIPIDLAKIVLTVCDFCAKHNIDLSEAIGLLMR